MVPAPKIASEIFNEQDNSEGQSLPVKAVSAGYSIGVGAESPKTREVFAVILTL